jgi:hypothetical protein
MIILCFSQTYETFRFISATCSFIVELRKAVLYWDAVVELYVFIYTAPKTPLTTI